MSANNLDRPGERAGSSLLRVIAPAVLILLVAALYARSARYEFVYDDFPLIVEQTTPRSSAELFDVFTEPHWRGLPYYRPVTRFTLVAQKYLHGERPGPFHLFNVGMMAVAALLAYALFRLPAFSMRWLPALAGAALFAAHPVASCVAYPISGRETLLVAVFMMAALYGFLRSGPRWYALSLVMFVGAMLCKEPAVILPGAFVLADLLGLSRDAPRGDLRAWVRRHGPVLGLLLLYVLVRSLLLAGSGGPRLALSEQPAGPLLSAMYFLQTTFAPFVELVYEPPFEVWFSAWRSIAWVAAVALLAWGVRHGCAALRLAVLFWAGWVLLTLLPTANLVAQEANFAERYHFLALLGVAGILGALVSAAVQRPVARKLGTVIAVVLLATCAAVSLHRGSYFRDDVAFHRQWLRTNPRMARSHQLMGQTLVRKGQWEEAALNFRRAIEIDPDYAEAHNAMGMVLEREGRLDEAVARFERAVALDPDFAPAHVNLGRLREEQGNEVLAADHFRRALSIDPDNAPACNRMGNLLFRQGDLERAAALYGRLLRIHPDSVEARRNLAAVLARQGDRAGAIGLYEEALGIEPGSAEVHNQLGNLLAEAGDLDGAADHYLEALRLDPDLAQVHNNLGVLFARQGELARAAEHFEAALAIDPGYAEARENLRRARAGLAAGE
jgi:tetratricopeptide (TPR) repeat protein